LRRAAHRRRFGDRLSAPLLRKDVRDAHVLAGFFFQAEDGIRDDLVTGVQTVLFRSASTRRKKSFKPPWTKSLSFVKSIPNLHATSARPAISAPASPPPSAPKVPTSAASKSGSISPTPRAASETLQTAASFHGQTEQLVSCVHLLESQISRLRRGRGQHLQRGRHAGSRVNRAGHCHGASCLVVPYGGGRGR